MRQATIPALSLLSALSLAMFIGCKGTMHTTYSGEAPQPLGQVLDQHWHTMITNAQASDFVIYQHEWIGTTVQLNAAGQEHVVQIARRLADVPFPVLIEPVTFRPFEGHRYEEKEFTDVTRERREILEADLARRETADADRRAEIDAGRRQEIVHFLSTMGYAAANDRVFVASPYAPGISGSEGARAFDRTLFQDNNGNNGNGRGGGFGGGSF
jgi:hypothetical protein